MKTLVHLHITIIFIFISISFILPSTTYGQQEKGDVQMQASITVTNSSSGGTSTTSYNGQYAVSKFFTKHAELGIALTAGGGSDFSYTYTSPFFNFNILSKDGKFVFYVGGQYLLTNTKSGNTEVSTGGVGAKAGIRSYVSPNIFYFVGPQFTALPNSQTQLDITAGIGVLFKKIKKAE